MTLYKDNNKTMSYTNNKPKYRNKQRTVCALCTMYSGELRLKLLFLCFFIFYIFRGSNTEHSPKCVICSSVPNEPGTGGLFLTD